MGNRVKIMTDESIFDKPIVTEVSPASKFYLAEGYHQNYYVSNKMKPYCRFVIQPKMNKLAKESGEKMKPEFL